MKKLMSLICLFGLVPLLHAQATLDQTLAKMDEVSKTFEGVQADIERTHVTVFVNEKDVSSGKFYYTRRGKEPRVRLDLMKPAEQQLLIDKGKLQLFIKNLNQVQETSLGEHQDVVEMIMALGFGQSSQDLKKNFNVSLAGEENIDGKKTTALDLKPKNSSLFKAVKMWMDQQKWVAVQIQTTEASGDYMIVKFANIKINPNTPESVFTLKLPKDVKVIKR